jgi:hypothetical protein
MDLEQESYDEFDDFYSHRTKSHAKEEYSVFGHGEVNDDGCQESQHEHHV